MTEANTDNANSGGQNNDANTSTGKGAQNVSELPEWAQNELSRARNDAASYRTKLRETETARDNFEKTLNDEAAKVTSLQTQVDDLKLNSAKLDVALEAFDVKGDQVKAFADRLRGATPDELKADAKTVVETFGIAPGKNQNRATDNSAGLGNDKPPTGESAFAEAVAKSLGWKS
jgi:chromosome segregation ATPase